MSVNKDCYGRVCRLTIEYLETKGWAHCGLTLSLFEWGCVPISREQLVQKAIV